MYCTQCFVELVEDANFCHNCGAGVKEAAPSDLSPEDEAATEADGVEAAGGTKRGGPHWDRREDATEAAAAEPPEREVWQGSFCPKAMVGSFASASLITFAALAGAAVGAVHDLRWLWIGLLVMIPASWIVQLLRLVKRWLSAHYRLTDRRLFRRLGVINRHKDQLDLARVESVRILQNVLHRFLDVGSIEIVSSDRRLKRLVMQGISNVDEVAETIRSLARAREMNKAEVVKEAVRI